MFVGAIACLMSGMASACGPLGFEPVPEDTSGDCSQATVEGVVFEHDPEGGDLYILLLNEQQYGAGEGEFDFDFSAIIGAGDARFSFEEVPYGKWILVGFQDDDGNGMLTQGLFGAPVEPWGTFAGESRFVPVSFEEGHFVVEGDEWRDIELRLTGFHW